MTVETIALRGLPEEASAVLSREHSVVLELAHLDQPGGWLAVAIADGEAHPGGRLPSFEWGGRSTHSWRPVRVGNTIAPGCWSYTQDIRPYPTLHHPDGSDARAVQPVRCDLRHNQALRVSLGSRADLIVVSTEHEEVHDLVPFRLAADVALFGVSHLGRVGSLRLAVAISAPGIGSLGSAPNCM